MSTTYGVLLVGGNQTHQENYARDFAADPRCRIIGVTDEVDVSARRSRLNQQLAADFGIPVLPDLRQALDRSDVQVTSVCVEFERRARLAIQCARAGKHVYIDKPLATTNEEAQRLVSAVRRSNVKSQMFSMLRAPWVQRAGKMVRSGLLGDLIGTHCDLLFAKGFAGTADLRRPRREHHPPERFTFLDSKRELFTAGVYSIGLMRWLSGREILRVYAQTCNYFFREHQENDVEDFAVATLEFEGGLTATLSAGRIGWLSHPSSGPVRIHLIGTKGSRVLDAARPRIEVSSDRPAWRPALPHPEDPMGFWSSTTREMRRGDAAAWKTVPEGEQSDASYFIDCIEEDRESDMNVAEGAAILKSLLACYQSATLGQPVNAA